MDLGRWIWGKKAIQVQAQQGVSVVVEWNDEVRVVLEEGLDAAL